MVTIEENLFLYLVYLLTDLHELWRHEAFTSGHMLDDFNIHGHYWKIPIFVSRVHIDRFT